MHIHSVGYARKPFLARFRCVTDSLEILTGTVGLKKHSGSVQAPGSDGLREATMSCIKAFCCKEVPPNYGGLRVKNPDRQPELDVEFCHMLCSRIEAFAADSAADEQLTARELQGGLLAGPAVPRLQEELTQFLSSLKAWFFFACSVHCSAQLASGTQVINRDRAHAVQRHRCLNGWFRGLSLFCACCRLLSRPWAAESFLKSCVVEFMEKQHSIAKLITFKLLIKQLYEDFRAKLPDAPCGKDLRYAPQRYGSESVTLLRILSCVPDVRRATSEEGHASLQTLQWLDTEKCLQLGMLGDVALEVQRLVEIADQNEEDIIEFPFHLEHFRQVLSKLFVEDMCLQVPCLTTVMLEQLKARRTFVLQQGRAVSLGGDITEDIKTRCLGRMSTYVALVENPVMRSWRVSRSSA